MSQTQCCHVNTSVLYISGLGHVLLLQCHNDLLQVMQCLCVGHKILYSMWQCFLHGGVGFGMTSIEHFRLAMGRASSYLLLTM